MTSGYITLDINKNYKDALSENFNDPWLDYTFDFTDSEKKKILEVINSNKTVLLNLQVKAFQIVEFSLSTKVFIPNSKGTMEIPGQSTNHTLVYEDSYFRFYILSVPEENDFHMNFQINLAPFT